MDTGERSRPEVPPSSGDDARPVVLVLVLVLVDDTIGSLASLLLAADIAGAQRGRLHVAHVSPPPVWTGMAGLAGMPVPASVQAVVVPHEQAIDSGKPPRPGRGAVGSWPYPR